MLKTYINNFYFQRINRSETHPFYFGYTSIIPYVWSDPSDYFYVVCRDLKKKKTL